MKKVAVFCEGGTDLNFLKNYITHLAKNHELNGSAEAVAPYIMNGKDNFFDLSNKRYAEVKNNVDAGQIKRILFILDADNEKANARHGGYQKTADELNKIIAALGFQEINQIYIMCDPTTQEGHLESFILATLPEAQQTCIQCFLACFQINSKEMLKTVVNDIYKMAYPNAPYNFGHDYFNGLKDQLTKAFA